VTTIWPVSVKCSVSRYTAPRAPRALHWNTAKYGGLGASERAKEVSGRPCRSTARPRILQITANQPQNPVRLKVEIHEIHEIQFSEVTNYRNPPALDGVCLRMAVLLCHVQSSTLHSERRHTSKSKWIFLGHFVSESVLYLQVATVAGWCRKLQAACS